VSVGTRSLFGRTATAVAAEVFLGSLIDAVATNIGRWFTAFSRQFPNFTKIPVYSLFNVDYFIF